MPVNKMIKHPETSKRLRRVFVNGLGWFKWNSAYHVYNSIKNYGQLQESHVDRIDFSMNEDL